MVFKVFVVRNDLDRHGVLDALKNDSNYQVDVYENNGNCPRDELFRRIKGVDAVLITPRTAMDQEAQEVAGPSLKVISTVSAG